MIKATVNFYDAAATPLAVVIGTGEDVKAPRQLAALEKQGWVITDDTTIAYKAYLAGQRQGDIAREVTFEAWIETVSEIEARPSKKQIEQAVALGNMEREQADALLAMMEQDSGE